MTSFDEFKVEQYKLYLFYNYLENSYLVNQNYFVQ